MATPTTNQSIIARLTYKMTSGTTSPTTFKVRAGAASGTLTVSGQNAAQIFGGVLNATLRVTEVT